MEKKMRFATLAFIATACAACAGVGQPQVQNAPPPAGALEAQGVQPAEDEGLEPVSRPA